MSSSMWLRQVDVACPCSRSTCLIRFTRFRHRLPVLGCAPNREPEGNRTQLLHQSCLTNTITWRCNHERKLQLKSNNGKPPVSGPRDTLIDADRLYRKLYCQLCEMDTQHIFCELQRWTGLGYACLECASERAELRAIKRDRRPKGERPQNELDQETVV